jgi:hypothetical protein
MGYKSVDLIRSAWKRFVLIVQPLQFHDNLDGPPGISIVRIESPKVWLSQPKV